MQGKRRVARKSIVVLETRMLERAINIERKSAGVVNISPVRAARDTLYFQWRDQRRINYREEMIDESFDDSERKIARLIRFDVATNAETSN